MLESPPNAFVHKTEYSRITELYQLVSIEMLALLKINHLFFSHSRFQLEVLEIGTLLNPFLPLQNKSSSPSFMLQHRSYIYSDQSRN